MPVLCRMFCSDFFFFGKADEWRGTNERTSCGGSCEAKMTEKQSIGGRKPRHMPCLERGLHMPPLTGVGACFGSAPPQYVADRSTPPALWWSTCASCQSTLFAAGPHAAQEERACACLMETRVVFAVPSQATANKPIGEITPVNHPHEDKSSQPPAQVIRTARGATE